MMSDKKYLTLFNKKLGYLKTPEERNLVTEIEYYIQKYGTINLADFISYAENLDYIKPLVNDIISKVDLNELDDEAFLDYIKALEDILNITIGKKYKGNASAPQAVQPNTWLPLLQKEK